MVIKGKDAFSPPAKPDIHITWEEDILLKDIIPEPVNSRGCLGLDKKDYSKIMALMVVVFISNVNDIETKAETFRYRSLLSERKQNVLIWSAFDRNERGTF